MRILALQPYDGGSHRAFLDGWQQHSHHQWDVLSLPPHHWKWRMRHSAVSLAERVRTHHRQGRRWDLLFCTDMLDLASWKGLAPPETATLPAVIYFHENQLTYPDSRKGERDLHLGFTNITSALAADSIWFNSAFHRDAFLAATRDLLARMPDHHLPRVPEAIRSRSRVEYPGIAPPPRHPPANAQRPLHVLWAARWEPDKAPGRFFDAIDRALAEGLECRISVIGGEARGPEAAPFIAARKRLGPRVVQWGYLRDREQYHQALADADVFVSTADHEFFGLAAVEAAAAGAVPILPQRLAYPEVFATAGHEGALFYPGDVDALVAALRTADHARRHPPTWAARRQALHQAVTPYLWPTRAAAMDSALKDLAHECHPLEC